MKDLELSDFYSSLPTHILPAGDLMARPECFARVPAPWHVLITDIEDSTGAIARGQHEAVNLIAAGSIIAVLNLARKHRIEVPFFFGGDGATILIPPSLLKESISALRTHRTNTRTNYGLHLRLGQFSIQELDAMGKPLRLAKWRNDAMALVVPVVLGDGLLYAEDIVKSEGARQDTHQGGRLDLSGMQCKWDRVEAPEEREEIVSLLVLVRKPDAHARVYRQVLNKLDEVYGPKPSRNPVSRSGLNLRATFRKLREEMKVKYGKVLMPGLLQNWVLTVLAKYLYFPFTRGGNYYVERMIELTDTLVLDGSLSTVISGNAAQRRKLTDYLEKLEKEGDLLFGYYVSSESVISCYVRDSLDDHIHFIDGAEGGYTQAAGMLKEKLRSLNPSEG